MEGWRLLGRVRAQGTGGDLVVWTQCLTQVGHSEICALHGHQRITLPSTRVFRGWYVPCPLHHTRAKTR